MAWFAVLFACWFLYAAYAVGHEVGRMKAERRADAERIATAAARADEVIDGDDEPDDEDDEATCLAIGMPVNAYLSPDTIVRGIVQGFMVRPDKDGKHHHVVLVEVGRHAVTVFEPDDVDPDDSFDRHAVENPTYRDQATKPKPNKDVN